MRRPTVSIALATFDGEPFLGEQLRSLAEQTVPPSELVVTDDGSTDGTMAVVERFAAGSPFPVRIHVNQRTLGFGENFLLAASLCTGDWIAFCDQDDVWLPTKIERCLEAIGVNPRADLLSHAAVRVDENLGRLPHRFPDHRSVRLTGPLGNRPLSVLPGFSCLVRRSMLQSVPHADRPRSLSGTGERQTHDWFACNVVNTYGHTLRIPDDLVLYRRHGASVSGDPDSRVRHRNLVSTMLRSRAEHRERLRQNAAYALEHRRYYERIRDAAAGPAGLETRTADAIEYYGLLESAYEARAGVYRDAVGVVERARAFLACTRIDPYAGLGKGRGFGRGAMLKDLAAVFIAGRSRVRPHR